MTLHSFWKHHPIFQDNPPDLLVKAPGRINLIGEHTDYHLGWVLPAAIEQAIWLAFSNDVNHGHVTIHSLWKNETKVLSLFENENQENWSSYFENILDLCRQNSLPVQPIKILLGGDLQVGAGMSSSSAITCGFLAGLNKKFRWELPEKELISLASAAEYQLGLEGGLMDQTAIFYGKKDHFLLIDNKYKSFDYIPGIPEDHTLILFDSGVTHELVNSAYNQRRKESEAVLPFFKKENEQIMSLRDISEEMLGRNETIIPAIPFQRAAYVLNENQRVLDCVEAMRRGDMDRVGALLYDSHEGLSNLYEVSCEELDTLVDLAKKQPGVKGSRMMGGGFGGCTINLVEKKWTNKIIQDISAGFKEATGKETKAFVVEPSDGITTYDLDQTKYQK